MKRKKLNPGSGNPNPKVRWKKGQSGNPFGPTPGIVPKKVLKEFTRLTVAEAYKKLMLMEAPELRQVSDSLTTPILEVIVARALLRDRMEGTTDNTDRILDRAIGRVPMHQMLSGADGSPLVPPQIVFQGIDTSTEEKAK